MSDPRFIQSGFDKTLAHFIEECGECLAAAGKTQRWGRDSVNPLIPSEQQETNEDWLRRELADLREVMGRLEAILSPTNLGQDREEVIERMARAIAKRRMLDDELGTVIAAYPRELFEEAFNNLWQNKHSEEDDKQRARFRADAQAAYAAALPLISRERDLEIAAHVIAWSKYGIAWKHCEQASKDEIMVEAADFLERGEVS